jgi:molybdopterin molybdotransferase
MLSVDEAQEQMFSRLRVKGVERVSLLDACGRVLAEDLYARWEMPQWDNSAMDGYAVRAADVKDVPTSLPLSQHIAAGHTASQALKPGTAARIFTGAPMPEGADCVVIQEDTHDQPDSDEVSFKEKPIVGQHIRRRGSDKTTGDHLLAAGRRLSLGDIAVLGSQGRSLVSVIAQASVAIVGTGSELIEIDAGPPGPGQLLNSNGVALASALRAMGATVHLYPTLPDDPKSILDTLRQASHSDMLITCGGMSVGEHDYVRPALMKLSQGQLAFWKVAIKPGKPVAFGHVGSCALFGLPGNPASAWVTFELFVRPAFIFITGGGTQGAPYRQVKMEHALKKGGKRQEYLRARLRRDATGHWWANTQRNQSSGAVGALAQVDALVVVPPDAPPAQVGDCLDAILVGYPVSSD